MAHNRKLKKTSYYCYYYIIHSAQHFTGPFILKIFPLFGSGKFTSTMFFLLFHYLVFDLLSIGLIFY